MGAGEVVGEEEGWVWVERAERKCGGDSEW